MWKEFKEFALRGSLLDIAVGIVIGAAFGALVASFVNDILMPPIGLLLGGADFSSLFIVLKSGTPPGPYATPAAAKAAKAVTWNYGLFVNALITFLIIAIALFLILKAVNRLRRPAPAPAPTTKACRYCDTQIPLKAVKCPNCTADLGKG